MASALSLTSCLTAFVHIRSLGVFPNLFGTFLLQISDEIRSLTTSSDPNLQAK